MTMTTPPKGTLGHQQHSPSSTIAYKDNESSADKFKVLKKQIREITQVRKGVADYSHTTCNKLTTELVAK